MWREYVTATSVEQALGILDRRRDEARIVSGATDLLIELERGVRRGIEALVDVSRIPGLDAIRLDERGWIRLGPLVTHNQACASAVIQTRALPLAQACWLVGAPQIRNRATIAGNIVTASPAGDTIAPLMALDAVVTLRSASRGERQVPLGAFFTGVRRTVMQPDEMLVEIAFPALAANERGTFAKLALRRSQAVSVVNASVIVSTSAHAIARARIALGAVAPTIVRAEDAEAFLRGKMLTEPNIAEAGRLAQRAARPIDDIRAPADYRLEMVRVLVARALRSIAAGEERGALPEHPALLATPIPFASPDAPADGAIKATLNGRQRTIAGARHKTLLRMLREDAGLIGTKEGCAEGECGACTVFLDGAAVMSCLVPAPRAHAANVTTVEGLARDGQLHPLQQAFIDEGAVQCGYCTPGFVMSGAKLLEERPRPARDEIEHAISGNLCRCTGYYSIVAAFSKAAEGE
jgi:carbon-monoxide dehydrogenase medium subunit